MRLLQICFVVVGLAVLVASSASAQVINEVRRDQPSGDANEYIEIKGTPGASLDGYSLVIVGDGSGGSGVIDGVTDLTGNIGVDGLFLVAEGAWSSEIDLDTSINLENSDNITIFLVTNNTASAGDDLDGDDDCSLDSTPWTQHDGVALVEEENPPAATECHYGAEAGAAVGPDGTFAPGHVYRCDDEWLIGGFTYPTDDTPGTPNTNCPVSNFDSSWGSVKTKF